MAISGKACVLFTGGKDSTYTIELLRNLGYQILCLVTVLSENEESYMLHTAGINLASLSALALEIPIVIGKTKGEKEKELSDIQDALRSAKSQFGFDTVGSGGIASAYQANRIESVAKGLELNVLAPLWGRDQFEYLHELVSKGYSFILTSVSAEGLDRSWLGRNIGLPEVSKIAHLSRKYGFNPAFEGGEAETFVIDCPLFKEKKIEIVRSSIDWRGTYGKIVVEEARLVSK